MRARSFSYKLVLVVVILVFIELLNGVDQAEAKQKAGKRGRQIFRKHNGEDDEGNGRLKNNFYKKSCPGAEELVRNLTWNKVKADATLPARLLRVLFHDCFVRGCDGSILLDSSKNIPAEKDSPANSRLAGFDVIDDIKAQLEIQCPGAVSCADVLALATRDAVSFQFNYLLWNVPTGRRDGTVSLASEVAGNIPSSFSDFNTLLQLFQSKGFDVNDLVLLSGAHTIGVAHCGAFSRRLYNFTGNGDTDPSLDADYAASLKTQCPNPASQAAFVVMDPPTPASLDNSYYDILVQNKGLFQSDAALLNNTNSANIVARLQRSNSAFLAQFGQAMKKMGATEVLTGNAGQIRKMCDRVN